MPNIEQAAVKESYVLVTFQWGDPPSIATTIKVTNANSDLDTRYGLFLSDPKMKIVLPKNTITGLDKSEISIDIFRDVGAFKTLITQGRGFPITTITVLERASNATDDNIRTMFIGRMSMAIRNPNGRTGIVRIRGQGAKNDLDQVLGFSTNEVCGWRFGDLKTCGFDLAPVTETVPLEITNNTEITLTGLAAHPNRYWRRGFVSLNGLKIRIREWQSGDTFFLSRLPPLNWQFSVSGERVKVSPGCDKSITVCRFWDREETFSGLGFAMQDYNPLFENPTQ